MKIAVTSGFSAGYQAHFSSLYYKLLPDRCDRCCEHWAELFPYRDEAPPSIAYGNDRADYTFIRGGMIPGVVVVQPDFPEIKLEWPFLWFENKHVITAASSFIVNAQRGKRACQMTFNRHCAVIAITFKVER